MILITVRTKRRDLMFHSPMLLAMAGWGIGDVTTSFFGHTVSLIPEPESYAMLLAWPGLDGFYRASS
jgi:hypothetical protein